MGSWSVSINGNDTAEDLKSEYQAAFYYYDVNTALEKIFMYVNQIGINETDEEEWCGFYYSLADFMWKKGILTDAIKHKCVSMIDSGFGLENWKESGEKILNKRLKVLAEFRKKITSPQCNSKKIKIDMHLNSVFDVGDIVAFQLKTEDKKFLSDCCFSEEFFKLCDGKYIVIKKVEDHISYQSQVVSEVADHWIVFKLYNKIFDTCPTLLDLESVGWAESKKRIHNNQPSQTFVCESNVYYFKQRNYRIVAKDNDCKEDYANYFNAQEHIFFAINRKHYNADTQYINAILNTNK